MQTHTTTVITGMGIISAIGDNLTSFSNSLRLGTSGIKHVFPTSKPTLSVNIASTIQDFSFLEKLKKLNNIPEEKLTKAKRLGQRAPFVIQTTILAALQAWEQAGLFEATTSPERIGLIIAGQNSTQNYQYHLISQFQENPEYLSPRYALEFLETNQVGILSELFDIEGEGIVVGGASATGNVGIIKGHQLIQLGTVDVCLVVGVVADLSPLDVQGFINIGAMGGKKYIDRPEKACRPFDKKHEGFIYGQASASVLLESETSATNRNISPLAAIKGYGFNLDKNSSANPNMDGEVKAMRSALSSSKLAVTDIDYINTHGSSSPLGDKTEADAIYEVFSKHTANVVLNATKGLTGHCLYTAGLVEAIATVLQMQEGFMHPNINLETPIRNDLLFCGNEAVDYQANIAMTNSFGFGGINTSIVLEKK